MSDAPPVCSLPVLKKTSLKMNVSLLLFSFVAAVLASSVEGQLYGRRCPPTCAIFCPFGRVKDRNGCDTCTCNDRPTDICPRGSRPVRPTRHCDSFSIGDCGLNGFCSRRGSILGRGVCCTRNIIEPVFHCPVNNIITTCEIRANSCIRHSDCPFGFKCCSRGCGKECVDAFGAGYRPGRGGGGRTAIA